MTWQELIKSALVELGVKVHNEALDQSDIDFGMEHLRLLLEEWSLSDLISYGVTRQKVTVTTVKDVFTIGPGTDNDIQMEQLNEVTTVTYAAHGDIEERPLLASNSAAIEQARINVSGDPQYYFYENSYPNARMLFDRPLPANSRFTIIGPTLISSASLHPSDTITMPQGYKRALLFNLAIQMSAAYGVKNEQLSASTVMLAEKSLRAIKVRNSRPMIPLTDKSMLSARTNFLRT